MKKKSNSDLRQNLFFVRVEVRTRREIRDPAAELISETISSLKLGEIQGFRQGKIFEFTLKSTDLDSAKRQAEEIADRLLANPQLEEFKLSVRVQRDENSDH